TDNRKDTWSALRPCRTSKPNALLESDLEISSACEPRESQTMSPGGLRPASLGALNPLCETHSVGALHQEAVNAAAVRTARSSKPPIRPSAAWPCAGKAGRARRSRTSPAHPHPTPREQ